MQMKMSWKKDINANEDTLLNTKCDTSTKNKSVDIDVKVDSNYAYINVTNK